MKFRCNIPAPIGFQLAPMLDVVFLLLVFFIVTQTFSLTEQDLKVKVPSASQPEQNDTRAINEIILNIRQDGTVIINREAYSQAQLETKLNSIATLAKNQPVRVRADADTRYQSVIDVIDVCKKAGIWNISFSTQKPRGTTAPN